MNYTLQRILAALMLAAFFPLFVMIALLTAICSGRPVFYRDRRLGMNMEMFTLLKFRTMNGDDLGELTPEQQEEWAKYGKLRDDGRMTRWGRLLRHSSLDELPQLCNVVRGEMALVGPRPIKEYEDRLYGDFSPLIHSVKPGITGLWQVSGRNLVAYHRRIAMNIYYVRNRSWKLDMWILFKTVWAVLSGRGAF